MQLFQDCGNSCAEANGICANVVSEVAANIHLEGTINHYKFAVCLGDTWQQLTQYSDQTILDPNGNLQEAVTPGKSGTVQPEWNATLGGSTADGGVTWVNRGALGNTCNPQRSFGQHFDRYGVQDFCAIPTINRTAGPLYGTLTGPLGSSSGSDDRIYPFVYDSTEWFNQPAPPALGMLRAADFNTTADQAVIFNFPRGFTRAVVTGVYLSNSSIPLIKAVGGIYQGIHKTGCVLVPATQTWQVGGNPAPAGYSVSATLASGSGACLNAGAPDRPGINTPVLFDPAGGAVWLSLTTAQGSSATADITVVGYWLQ
jgi:hypothetical protein